MNKKKESKRFLVEKQINYHWTCPKLLFLGMSSTMFLAIMTILSLICSEEPINCTAVLITIIAINISFIVLEVIDSRRKHYIAVESERQ